MTRPITAGEIQGGASARLLATFMGRNAKRVATTRPTTLGELRAAGWESVPVKEELRRNAVARLRAGEPLFPEVLGFENTVLPQLENALLAGHDELTLQYGLVPRTNRGIFAINELPDLADRR